MKKKPTLKIFRKVLYYLSSEWVLVRWEVPNGGAAVFLRSLISSAIVFALALVFMNVVDPQRTWAFSATELRSQLVQYLPWYGIVFGGIYTALYARFASQWAYLANVYNSIKQAEVTGVLNSEALAQWKAGFIEDAENLHLECKSSLLAVIEAWLAEPSVESSFCTETVAGDLRLRHLRENLIFSKDLVRKNYARQHGIAIASAEPERAA